MSIVMGSWSDSCSGKLSGEGATLGESCVDAYFAQREGEVGAHPRLDLRTASSPKVPLHSQTVALVATLPPRLAATQ